MSNTQALIEALTLGLLWVAFTLWCYRAPLLNGLANRQLRRQPLPQTLVAYASEGGNARSLAQALTQALHQQGTPARLFSLNELAPALPRLVQHAGNHPARLLLVASTTGDGEAPLNARRFVRAAEQTAPQGFAGLEFGVLALGDSRYQAFCQFGLSLAGALAQWGARPLFDTVCVDRMQRPAIHDWWQRLVSAQVLNQAPPAAAETSNSDSPAGVWTFIRRERLNPASDSQPLYLIQLKAPEHATWQAGDIVCVDLPDKTGMREYSIASAMSNTHELSLIVRARYQADGTPGAGSGLLCQRLQSGESINVRVRSNPAFHHPHAHMPVILIGAGSGMAGLRAHWQQRALSQRPGPLWLIYGERHPQHDCILADELNTLQEREIITRCDRVFSRASDTELSPVHESEQCHIGYVQDVLRADSQELLRWITQGASILVCGSLNGMGRSVDECLRQTLGHELIDSLTDAGRYLRDVY
ncbi:NADPH cytochrome P450 oxidoreductase family protein [Thalassolituus sp. LLYu03]|uniref:NADPH cytochrome P450 oxidoreductase family protein n=1 Tax=Thalassolituus sp. LLYu03 TaxID=3421656 RepID=UPI003D2C77CE